MEKIPENIKTEIVDFLRRNKQEFNVKQIAEGIGKTSSTALKWCEVLKAEGVIDIKDFGNVKIVKLNYKRSKKRNDRRNDIRTM